VPGQGRDDARDQVRAGRAGVAEADAADPGKKPTTNGAPGAANPNAPRTNVIPNFPRVGDMLNPVEEQTVLQHDLEQTVDKLFGREHRQIL